jgi:serine/threonine-protein kinase
MPVPRPFGVSEDQAATLVVPMATDARATGVTAPVATGNAASKVTPPRRRRRGWIGLLAVLLVGALVAGAAWVYGAARTVTMPSVVGLTPTAAAAKLSPLGLSLDSSATDYSESVAAGKIITTDPDPGAPAKQDSTVSAVVSKGPERHAVPAVAGMSVADATAALEDASLTVGASTQAYDEKLAVGVVVTTNPAPATELKRGQPVALVLSKGPAPVKLANYVGKPADQVTSALEKSGMKVTSTTAYSKTVAEGSVVSMTPAAGKTVPKGTTVALVVSKGPPMVIVPNVVDKFEPEAKRILIAAGFKVNAIYPLIATPIDRVLSQSAKAGTQLPWGSTITISVV